MLRTNSLTAALLAFAAVPALAQDRLVISVENLAPTNGFFLTPTWLGLHDGSFDLFDVGSAVSPGLEALAEDGIIDTLSDEFAAPGRREAIAANAAGFGGAPVIDAGETATTEITINNAAAYRYLSFASMVIPSNDAFIGNANPTAYEIFDAAGDFNGELEILLTGANIWDAGTEVNDTLGAAFSAIGGIATDENGVAAAHPGLANFEGTGTAAGFDIGAGLAPGPSDLVARITVSFVPEPASALLGALGLAGFAATLRRD